jgi:heme/copper-type cytochrome/quinol oxidase subunit 2
MNILSSLAAASGKIDPGSIGISQPVKNANGAISSLLSTAYMGAGIVAVIVIVVAAYFYVTSNGDPSTTKRAREAILGAVIGIIMVMLAFVITQFVLGRF